MTIETKFNIGDEVWFVSFDERIGPQYKALLGTITGFNGRFYYTETKEKIIGTWRLTEKDIFKTKEELIESLFN